MNYYIVEKRDEIRPNLYVVDEREFDTEDYFEPFAVRFKNRKRAEKTLRSLQFDDSDRANRKFRQGLVRGIRLANRDDVEFNP